MPGRDAGRQAEAVEAFLRHADLTATLDHEGRRALAADLEAVEILGGTYLMNQGETGDAMYFLVHGRLGAVLDTDDGPQLVGHIFPGAVVGELALLGDVPRLASVVALRDSRLLRLSKEAFERVSARHPAILRTITRTVVHRLAERGTVDRPPSKTIAVLGIGLSPTDADAVVATLLAALGRHGTVGVVVVDDQTDPSSMGGALHAAEDANAFVLLTGAVREEQVSWTLRSADAALVVTTAGQAVDLGAAGPPLADLARDPLVAPQIHLVVLHEGRTPPAGTGRWLDAVGTQSAFHLNMAGGDGLRLARFLAGKAVAVALGGGGARGFAHLGVLRALDEADVAIDVIGGTSIGALVAGLYAMGWDADEREERALEALSRSGPLFAVTLPVLSLSSAAKLQSLLTDPRYFGERQIEDLWLPYCCVSADLTTAQPVIHERGSLAFSVRASASLPGVLPPVVMGDRWLVDGGVLDNLPITSVRQRNGDGPVIAVDIRPRIDLSLARATGTSVSGWALVGRRGRDEAPRGPSLIDVLVRSNVLGSVRALQETLADRPVDLLLRPPVADHKVLDFRRGPVLIRTAYEHTVTALESAPPQLWP